MAEMTPSLYARNYWYRNIPIINDDNEIVSTEFIEFGKYRLWMGFGAKPPKFPPGQMDFVGATSSYAYRMISKNKPVRIVVTDIWDTKHEIIVSTMDSFRQVQVRGVQAFFGKCSPEDMQITLQLAARCGLATQGLQRYIDEIVDHPYPRLGLDCNGFVGNYLHYRSPDKKWGVYAQPPSTITESTMIKDMVTALGTKVITNADQLLDARRYVLGLVGKNGEVINQLDGSGGVAHVVITEALALGKREVRPPVPKEYVKPGVKYVHLSTLEATPAVGLGFGEYAVLNIDKNGVATVYRGNVTNTLMRVKIYPVEC